MWGAAPASDDRMPILAVLPGCWPSACQAVPRRHTVGWLPGSPDRQWSGGSLEDPGRSEHERRWDRQVHGLVRLLVDSELEPSPRGGASYGWNFSPWSALSTLLFSP